MKKFYFLFGVFTLMVALFVGAFSSCTISLSDDDDDEVATGTIQLTISSILSQATSDNSRAIVKSDKVVLTLIKADGSQEVLNAKNSSNKTTKYTAEVPVGTYSLKVDVYNAKNSETSPITTGTSDSFSVEAKKTSKVAVSCVPNAEFVTEKSIGASFDEDLSSKKEYWYSFVSVSDETDITISRNTTDDASEITFAVFDSTGMVAKKVSTSADKTNAKADLAKKYSSLKVSTQKDSVYYFVVYNKTEDKTPSVNINIASVEASNIPSNVDTPLENLTGTIEIVIS